MPRLEGKIAVITGSSGIGLATAKRFVKEGAYVFITGHRQGGATKATLRSFVRRWTAELASKGIRANMVTPSPIETPLLETHFRPNVGAMKDRFVAMTPFERIGRPEKIASEPLCSSRPTAA